ncbi:MAG: hypothetical protein P8N47_06175 [Bacteroidia bacterium]|nr:hypothetical protein [Bacteroidia bacterium]
MKINKILLLIAVFISNAVVAQSSKEKITFSYQQLPLFPMSADKTYNVNVILPYEDDITAQKEVIAAENKELKEEAKQEKKDYDNKKVGAKLVGKVLLGESKPTGRAKLVEAPFYQTIWNRDEIKSKVTIPGLEQNEGATALITVFINRFDYTYNAQHIPEKGYYYRVNGTGTVTMEAKDENGAVVSNKTFSASKTGKGNDFQSKYFRSEYARDKDWNLNKEAKLRAIESNKLRTSMSQMAAYLKSNMGYNSIPYKGIVFTFKSKKHDYTALNSAYPTSVEVYNMLNTYPLDQDTKGRIVEITEIWKAETENIDGGSKKARINAEVGEGLYLNLAFASIWLEDFSKANVYLAKYKVLDPKGKNKVYKSVQKLLNDQKARFAANQ